VTPPLSLRISRFALAGVFVHQASNSSVGVFPQLVAAEDHPKQKIFQSKTRHALLRTGFDRTDRLWTLHHG
jgi:hypothetical protein